MENWQQHEEPWRAEQSRMPADLSRHAGIAAVIDGLKSLGMLKAGEQPRTLHQYGCPAGKPPWTDGTCICHGGPELMYPDFDELTPIRFYRVPERFNQTV